MKIIIIILFMLHYVQANQQITLQLNWLHQFQFAGYYIAKEKGFYKDAGIDLSINEIQYAMNLSEVLENKEADFAIGRSSLLINKKDGKDVVGTWFEPIFFAKLGDFVGFRSARLIPQQHKLIYSSFRYDYKLEK